MLLPGGHANSVAAAPTLASTTHELSNDGAALTMPPIGARIGEGDRFELLEMIGKGGSAVVFKGRDHELDRIVAMKFVRAVPFLDSPSGDSLVMEARATARLNHENIVTVYDIAHWQNIPYFLMEHVEGHSLETRMARRTLLPSTALDIAIQVAAAVEHAHAAGVLHLDLKPSNVLINVRGKAKVIDFGVAGFIASARARPHAGQQSSFFVGTPAYMAPEQWAMQPLDERTDVWGVAALLFEMLTGRPIDVRRPTTHGAAACVERPFPNLTSDLANVLRRALESRPDDRFSTVSELLQSLRLAGGTVSARGLATFDAR